jgi:orotate phosphoribosyltransferase
MDPEQILAHFRESGALLEGHFLLSSGAAQRTIFTVRTRAPVSLGRGPVSDVRSPSVLSEPRAIATGPLNDFDTVASPAIGGLIIGYTVAAALKQTIHLDRATGWQDDPSARFLAKAWRKGLWS